MKKIYKYFTEDRPVTMAYINWFYESFPISEFYEVDLVLYLFLQYCATLGIIAKRSYLEIFLSTELKVLVRTHNIRFSTLTATHNYDEITAFEQAVQIISTTTMDTYDNYCSEVIEEDIFKVLVAQFMNENLKTRIMNTFTEQFTLMNQGQDAIVIADNTNVELSTVRDIYNLEKIAELDFLLGHEDNSGKSKDTARLISKTGVPAIDEDYGGLFSKALITLAGQPGSGKTRFMMALIVYPALVHFKVGVRVDSLELTLSEMRNILVAIHIANVYKMKIDDRSINIDSLSDEQRKIVESARIDLFESNKYGKVFIKTDNLVVETMKRSMMNFIKLNKKVQVWCVDYTGLIKSIPTGKYDRKLISADIIDQALIIGKEVAKEADICSVFLNQYNEKGNDAAFSGKPITVGMIHGGQSIQRHSDYDLAMTYTEEQEIAKMRMLSTTKVRSARGFKNVPLSVDLSISRFTQINKIEERG